MDFEGGRPLLDRRRRLVAHQLPHERKDDVRVGAVAVLLGLPDLEHLEPVVGGPPDVHQQPVDAALGPRTSSASMPSYIATGAGTVVMAPYIRTP